MQALSDDALRAKTGEFRQRLDNGEEPDDLLIESFAVTREAATRCWVSVTMTSSSSVVPPFTWLGR